VDISNEAVEAAHKAWRAQNTEPDTIFEYNLRAALEAAGPYIAAEAWDEGHERGFWNGRLSELTAPYDAPDPLIGKQDAEANNPYRSQA
jgi:hypothetical protein